MLSGKTRGRCWLWDWTGGGRGLRPCPWWGKWTGVGPGVYPRRKRRVASQCLDMFWMGPESHKLLFLAVALCAVVSSAGRPEWALLSATWPAPWENKAWAACSLRVTGGHEVLVATLESGPPPWGHTLGGSRTSQLEVSTCGAQAGCLSTLSLWVRTWVRTPLPGLKRQGPSPDLLGIGGDHGCTLACPGP